MIEFTEEDRARVRIIASNCETRAEYASDTRTLEIAESEAAYLTKLVERPAEKCCQNCVEVKADVVTLPDWPAGTGPCDLCLTCIGLMLDSYRKAADSTEGQS